MQFEEKAEIYRVLVQTVEILRVLNTAQRWPPVEHHPGYERDEGPLSSQQLQDVRKVARRKAPTGKVVSKKKLR